ncbi:MAG: hypothetical protein P1U50_01155 [Parvibaculaceae bacterium]|nr:hypothetical protein [Parvibaculaceae bacterium]
MPLNWPSAVPTYVAPGSWVEALANGGVTFQPEYGAPLERKRVTISGSSLSVSMELSAAESKRLRYFFEQECSGRANSFYFINPITGERHEYRFTGDEPFRVSDAQSLGRVNVAMTWYQQPGGAVILDVAELSPTLWIDASDGDYVTETSGDVSALADKSGNGNGFAQASGALQPTTGNTTQNSLNFLELDGSQYMAAGGVLDYQAEFTSFFVFKSNTSGEASAAIVAGFGGADEAIDWDTSEGVGYWYDAAIAQSGNDSLDAFHVACIRYASGVATLYLDGAPVATGSIERVAGSDAATIGRLTSGAGNIFSGGVGEFFVTDQPLAPTQIAAVTSLLNTKWGL